MGRFILVISILSTTVVSAVLWRFNHRAFADDRSAASSIVIEASNILIPTPMSQEITPTDSTTHNTTAEPSIKSVTLPSQPLSTASLKPMSHWGALIRPYGLKTGNQAYTKDQLRLQFELLKELGTTDVRANIEQEQATNDDIVALASEYQLSLTLVLEPPTGYLDTNTYQQAYNYAVMHAARYTGKVAHYQLLNEVSGVAIRPTFPGNRKSDYDQARYQFAKDAVRGLSNGVHDTDPSAGRVVTSNWLGTAIMDKLEDDKVEFDIIGWNWYSDMGTDLIKKIDTKTTLNIPTYLSKNNKPFWIVETNRRQGSFDLNFNAQADYLNTFVKNVASHHNTQGMFVYMLIDECGDLDKETGHLGLVSVKKLDSGLCAMGDKKPAFQTFKDLITKYK